MGTCVDSPKKNSNNYGHAKKAQMGSDLAGKNG